MSERRTLRPSEAWRLAFDVMVFAPIGLGAAIVEDGPDALRRGRQELRNARFVGQMAVDRGVAELKRRVEEATEQPATHRHAIDVDAVETTGDGAVDGGSTDTLGADDLALPDYDTLPAIDIVDKLEHLSVDERAAIGAYERANRQRRTVLGKLEQLGDG